MKLAVNQKAGHNCLFVEFWKSDEPEVPENVKTKMVWPKAEQFMEEAPTQWSGLNAGNRHFLQ